MNKSTSILKSAPFVLFIAMTLAGCPGESTGEAFCNKAVQCDRGPKGLTAAQCAEREDKSLTEVHAQSACASTAEKLDDLDTCLAGLSCGDLAKTPQDIFDLLPPVVVGTPQSDVPVPATQVPQGTPCREELQALANIFAEADDTDIECVLLYGVNHRPGADFHGGSGAACQKDEQCPGFSSKGDNGEVIPIPPNCFAGRCMTQEDSKKFGELFFGGPTGGTGAGEPGSGAPSDGGG